MPNDVSQTEIVVTAAGALTASLLITLLLQAVKDWYPSLSGRRAVAAVYLSSGITAFVILAQLEADPATLDTWISGLILMLVLTNTARGIYAAMNRST